MSVTNLHLTPAPTPLFPNAISEQSLCNAIYYICTQSDWVKEEISDWMDLKSVYLFIIELFSVMKKKENNIHVEIVMPLQNDKTWWYLVKLDQISNIQSYSQYSFGFKQFFLCVFVFILGSWKI